LGTTTLLNLSNYISVTYISLPSLFIHM
jgi:hypothetical protein